MLLLSLPEEVLALIFAGVDGFSNRLNVSLTCREFHRVNEPYLHSDIRFRDDVTPGTILHVFLENLKIPHHLRSLSLPIWDSDSEIPEEDAEKVLALVHEIDPDKNILRVTNVEETGLWLTNSLISLAFCLCRNVQELELRLARSTFYFYWMVGLSNAIVGNPWPNDFSKLVKLKLVDTDSEELIHTCLKLPALRELHWQNFTDSWPTNNGTGNVDHVSTDTPYKFFVSKESSKVEVLHFDDTNMWPWTLNDLILAVQKSLSTFHLHFTRRGDNGSLFNLFAALKSLERAAATLTSLELSCDGSGPLLQDTLINGHLISLDGFNLKRLRCDIPILLASTYKSAEPSEPLFKMQRVLNIVPPSLETFEIVNRKAERLDALIVTYFDALAAAKSRGIRPNLRRVAVAGFTVFWVPPRLAETGRDGKGRVSRETPAPSQVEKDWGLLSQCAVPIGFKPRDLTLVPHAAGRKQWNKVFGRLRAAGVELCCLMDAPGRPDLPVDDDPFGSNVVKRPLIMHRRP